MFKQLEAKLAKAQQATNQAENREFLARQDLIEAKREHFEALGFSFEESSDSDWRGWVSLYYTDKQGKSRGIMNPSWERTFEFASALKSEVKQ